MTNYCEDCEIEKCKLRDEINFCEDCKDYPKCGILSPCEAGHYVECNNGFMPKDCWFEEDEE